MRFARLAAGGRPRVLPRLEARGKMRPVRARAPAGGAAAAHAVARDHLAHDTPCASRHCTLFREGRARASAGLRRGMRVLRGFMRRGSLGRASSRPHIKITQPRLALEMGTRMGVLGLRRPRTCAPAALRRPLAPLKSSPSARTRVDRPHAQRKSGGWWWWWALVVKPPSRGCARGSNPGDLCSFAGPRRGRIARCGPAR